MINPAGIFQEYKEPKKSYRETRLRFLALFFACMVMLGEAYCFDNPMALQFEIKELFDVDNFSFNLLYTMYSLPNIVLPFFGGILIDKIGPRIAIVIFSMILLIGQLICVWAAFNGQYWLLLLGRIIFGIGSENLNVAQNSIMVEWFKDREMSMAIGLCLSIPKIGSAMNSLMSPIIVQMNDGVAYAMLVGAGFLLFSQLCGVILIWMDLESDKRENNDLRKPLTQQVSNIISLQPQTQQNLHTSESKEIIIPPKKPNSNKENSGDDSPHLLSMRDSDDDDENTQSMKNIEKIFEEQDADDAKAEEEDEQAVVKEEINLKDIAKMSGTFWILLIICMLSDALFIPFLDNGNELFQERYHYKSTEAGLFLVIPYLIAAILTPFVGVFGDRLGHRTLLIITTSIIFLITHMLFAFISCDGVCGQLVAPLVTLGLCFAFYASIVIASVPIVVKHSLVGTAFGLVAVFQNAGLSIFPLITGWIFNQFSVVDDEEEPDAERGYKYQSYFFVGMSFLLVFITVALTVVDRAGEQKLSMGRKRTHSRTYSRVSNQQLALKS